MCTEPSTQQPRRLYILKHETEYAAACRCRRALARLLGAHLKQVCGNMCADSVLKYRIFSIHTTYSPSLSVSRYLYAVSIALGRVRAPQTVVNKTSELSSSRGRLWVRSLALYTEEESLLFG